MRDFLLNLPNKSDSLKTCDEWIKNRSSFSMILIDLDNFFDIYNEIGVKRSQEFFGHIGQRILDVLDDDFLGWLEGDEFLILTTQEGDLTPLIENIFSTNSSSFDIFEAQYQITYSLGISKYPQNAAYTRDLFQKAALAKYGAKKKKNANSFLYAD